MLAQMGLAYEVLAVEVDESPVASEAPDAFVLRLAMEKIQEARRLRDNLPLPVIGSDTCIFHENQIIGKPSSKAHAVDILQKLSGNVHQVFTGVAIADNLRSLTAVQVSRVWMRELTRRDIEAYWTTGEPRGKAGAYAIQGLGAVFVEKIEGSYSGIMGLPIFETARLLEKFGINCVESYVS